MGLRSRKTQQETKHERKTDGAGHPPVEKSHFNFAPWRPGGGLDSLDFLSRAQRWW